MESTTKVQATSLSLSREFDSNPLLVARISIDICNIRGAVSALLGLMKDTTERPLIFTTDYHRCYSLVFSIVMVYDGL